MADRSNKTQAAVETLAREILAGRHPADRPLPSEADLCTRFRLSRMTVRVILARLEQRGLIYRHQGKGTFVRPDRPGEARTLAFLLKDMAKASSPYLLDLLRGADSRLAGRGLNVGLVGDAPSGWTAEFRRTLAGVIVIPNHVERAEIVCLRGLRLPHLVMMDSDLPGPSVLMGVAAAARAVAAGLLALGHRRFALISGHREHADRHKRAGIRAALAKAGLRLDDVPDRETDYRMDAGQAAAQAVLDLNPRPTAVICFDDTLALQMISAAQRRGLRVPEDMSVTGFNDAAFSALVTPPISTVRFPAFEAGAAAAAAILEARATGAFPKDIVLGHEVVWRASTGPAPVAQASSLPERNSHRRPSVAGKMPALHAGRRK